MPSSALSAEVDVCILGAGPHGLATALHLMAADPALGERMAVIDPSGSWLSTWREQFARLEIDNLRSPIVHHPAPEVSALARHVAARDLPRSGLPYELPTTAAFDEFCDHLIATSGVVTPIAARPRRVRPSQGRIVVSWAGHTLTADRLVVATNPHRRVVPTWVEPLLGRFGALDHAADVDLRTFDRLDGEHVVVVGGGLTAGHLVAGAAGRGATVEQITRRPIVRRPFDTDPGWLGPRFLRGFDAVTDPEQRVSMAKDARGGGTMPAWMHDRLVELEATGAVAIREGSSVSEADVREDGRAELRLDDGDVVAADRIWLATGTVPSIESMRCLSDVVADMGLVDGVPIVDDDLKAGPHPVHVIGRLAMTALGPAAGNLWGAQRAAERITTAITGVELDLSMTAIFHPRQAHR